jgi:ribose transport system substrate-binding protein
MKKQNLVIAVLAIVIGVLIGTQLNRGPKESQASQQLQTKQRFAMNVVVSGVPFWTDTRETWEKIGKTVEGVETVFGGPTDTDASKQIEEMDALIAEKVDGIVIAPCDSDSLTPEIDKAVAAGIPVVTYLTDSPKSKRICYVTSSLEGASRLVGDYVANIGGYTGSAIVSIGAAGSEEQRRRAAGFKEIVKQHPGMELVQTVEDKFDDVKGADEIKAALIRTPDVRFIFGCNSRSAAAAVTALKELGKKPGDVLVSAWDYDSDVLKLIKDGWVQASAAQQSSFMTELCFGILQADGKNFLYPQSLDLKKFGVPPLPTMIEVPVTLITSTNADAYVRVQGK